MEIIYKNKKRILPDFFVVGAARSGTTSLYYSLKQHPKIFMPPNKEPAFFVFMDIVDSQRITTIETYEKLFKNLKNNPKIGEASVVYLYKYNTAITNIKKIYGDLFNNLRILIILRNPVDRAYSHYLWAIKMGMESLSFEEAIREDVINNRMKSNFVLDYIGYGMYYNQIKSYLETFDNIKVILFDELLNDTQRVINEIFLFLQVSPIKVNFKVYNAGGKPNKFYGRLLYSFLWKENTIKVFLKRILPQKIRDTLKWKINDFKQLLAFYILRKNSLQYYLRQQLIEIYQDDLKKLKALSLLNENQKKIVDQWLDI